MWKSAGWLAKKHGVSRIAIGNWIREGRYEKVERTKGGHYRVWVNDPECVIGYARVSSRKQMSSMESQSAIIREHYPAIEIVSDVGSGFNFKRRGLKSILERCLSGGGVTVVCCSSSILTQTGFITIRKLICDCGGHVVVINGDT